MEAQSTASNGLLSCEVEAGETWPGQAMVLVIGILRGYGAYRHIKSKIYKNVLYEVYVIM